MAEVGILITAKDAATAVFKGVKGTATQSMKSVRAVAEKASAAFDSFGKVATGVNQALEIGRKAWELLRIAVGETIAKALEFRTAGDPVRKWFEDMQRDAELLRASIGDALIPVVQGLAEGLGLVGRGARDWVRDNRKLIATGILEWTIKISKALTSGVAKATLAVVKVWKGWEQIIIVIKAGIEKFFASAMSGAKKVIAGMADVVSLFDEDLARGMRNAADLAGQLGSEFEKSSDKSLEALTKSVDELKQYEGAINNVKNVVLKAWTKAEQVAHKTIQDSITGTNKKIEEGKKAEEDARKAAEARAKRVMEISAKVDKFLEGRHAAQLERLALEESIIKANEERQVEAADSMMEKAQTIGEALSTVISNFASEQARADDMMAEAQKAVAEGAADATEKINAAREAQAAVAGNAAKQSAIALIDSVTAQVAALAVQASAGAFASMASIPVVGPALGAAAAAAAGAAVMALGAGLHGLVAGMAQGGVVGGGSPGRDSVPAMLMPGEQVMSIPERQAMQRFMSRLLGVQAGQAAIGSPTQGSGRSIVVNQKTEVRTWTPNIVEETKMARRLETRARKRLERQGMLLEQKAV